jgi:hypothetical protein
MRFTVTLNFDDDEIDQDIEAPTPIAAIQAAEVSAARTDWKSWVLVHAREPGEA